jgi:hypothetical protein
MNIWTPLPNDTNTLYVVKLPVNTSGEPLRWRPDPGTRVKILCGSFTISTPAFGAIRTPRWRLLYGSDVVATFSCGANLPINAIVTVTIGKFYRQIFGPTDRDYNIYWDSGIYLTHDMEIEFGSRIIEGLDLYDNGVLYIDVWQDMTVRMGS